VSLTVLISIVDRFSGQNKLFLYVAATICATAIIN